MAAGTNYISRFKGSEVDDAIDLTATNKADIATNNGKIATNTLGIAGNKTDITDVDNRVSALEGAGTSPGTGYDARITKNKDDISILNGEVSTLGTAIGSSTGGLTKEVNTNTADISTEKARTDTLWADMYSSPTDVIGTLTSLPTTYAAIDGDATKVFHVGDATSTTEAINYRQSITLFAKTSGDETQLFECATPTSPNQAVNISWVNTNVYSKTECDAKYQSVASMANYYTKGETYSKSEVDTLFANHTANASAHHVKT